MTAAEKAAVEKAPKVKQASLVECLNQMNGKKFDGTVIKKKK